MRANDTIPDMHRFEDTLRRYGVYSLDRVQIAPIREILHEYELHLLGKGIHSRVYKVGDEAWVVKEGRWDIDIPIVKHVNLTVPTKITEDILSKLSLPILPTWKRIKDTYEEYQMMRRYLGYKEYLDNPETSDLYHHQETIRQHLPQTLGQIEDQYGIEIPDDMKSYLRSDQRFHNFLPTEYLLLGESMQPKHTGKITYFIFQPYIKGPTLAEVKLQKIPRDVRYQLKLLAYLILLMHHDIHMIPDTRPRFPLFQAYDWFTKTDNVIISDKGLKFIDTRWMWKTKENMIKRGFFIPEQCINRAKHVLIKKEGYDP